MPKETATFAAGCFWGVEATFRRIPGVTATAVGYIGGTGGGGIGSQAESPTYESVCTGQTGHAEAVRVEFDPEQVTYDELLETFWSNHNPTTPNRQGPDVGTQYRSAIFCASPEQHAAAQASKEKHNAEGKFAGRIVTEIQPSAEFHRAEEYHQQYLEKRGQSSCHL